MGTTWIPVFVLTLSECVAPVGKTVCRPQELHLQFVDRAECETALREIVELKSLAENIIVDRDASRCERSATTSCRASATRGSPWWTSEARPSSAARSSRRPA